MNSDDTKTTVPTDPSTFGRYWMQRDGMECEESWEVWRWQPECGCWFGWRGSIEPDYAFEQGWRCVAPAPTPSEVSAP